MSTYTIDAIENSTIIIDDEYERRSLADQGWEMTDRPVLQSPLDGATGVSQDPTFDWAEYVKDIPVPNLVYKLEVVPIATSGETPNWANAIVVVTTDTSANLREQLDSSQFYAWRVSALSRTQSESFIDLFERAELGDDYENTSLTGTGSVSISANRLRIGGDGTSETSRYVVKLLKNFENPTIYLRGVEFTSIASGSQPTIYFNTEGDFANNQQNGYYLFFFEDTMRLGKVVNNDPGDLQQVSFSRVIDTPYDIKIRHVNGHNRITMWLSSEEEPSPQIDHTDSGSPYTAGGISFLQLTGSSLGGFEYLIIDDIEATFSEGQATIITGVTVSGSTSDLTEGDSRQFTAEASGSGNVQQSFDWEVTGGTFEETSSNSILFTAAAGAGACSVTATSTQDDTQSDTVNFNRVEESTDPAPSEGSAAEDIEALEAFEVSTNVASQLNGWTNIDLSDPPEGVYVENGRVMAVKLDGTQGWYNDDPANKYIAGKRGVNGGYGITGTVPADFVQKLGMCKYINLKHNDLSGDIPNIALANLEELMLNGREGDWRTYNIPASQKITSTSISWRSNEFTGDVTTNCPKIKTFECMGVGDPDHSPGELHNAPAITSIPNFSESNQFQALWADLTNITSIPDFSVHTNTLQYFSFEYCGGLKNFGLQNLAYLNDCGDNFRLMKFNDSGIGGTIPDFSALTKCHDFNISFGGITGGFDAYFIDGTWEDINQVAIDRNQIDQEFPNDFANTGLTKFICIPLSGSPGFTGGFGTVFNNRGIINTDFSYNDFSEPLPQDLTHLNRIRNLRWSGNNIPGPLSDLDWYNTQENRNSADTILHPLRDFSRLNIDRNKYAQSDFDRIVPKFAWEIEAKSIIWYYENKYRNGSGHCNIITNVDPNFSTNDYISAGFSSAFMNDLPGSTGYEKMRNHLNEIYIDGTTGPGNGYASYKTGNQNP